MAPRQLDPTVAAATSVDRERARVAIVQLKRVPCGMCRRSAPTYWSIVSLAVSAGFATSALTVTDVGGQVATEGIDTTRALPDPGDVAGAARAAQAGFERQRIASLPLSPDPYGGDCDEIVGRLCTTYSEGEWYPVPEDPRIRHLREDLLSRLDSLQRLAPSSDWILGQRVWYRSEAGDWDGALRTASVCGGALPWWCAALRGYALHGKGDYTASARAFDQAFALMPGGVNGEEARVWRIPEWPVDGDVREVLEALEGDVEAEERMLDRLWSLADPLYLVEGNDRLTVHYARWTVARLRDRARNPFRLSWGSDLEQLTIRHGWEMGWERTPARDFSTLDHVIGHKHPEGRDFMPPGTALEAPEAASVEELRADRRRPRSLYAPDYAPVLLPMDAQIAVFPRGSSTVIVATHFLPEDTTFHAMHEHARPWMENDGPSRPDRAGLFAWAADAGTILGVTSTGASDGTLLLEVPVGQHDVVSVESFSPDRRRAGRRRVGLARRDAPEDVATLSDILLLRAVEPLPETLEEALDLALPRTRVGRADRFAIAWEVAGLGFRPETLEFEVTVERTDRGVLRRVGEFLRLADRPSPVALSWSEPGPGEPGADFHQLSLELPVLDEGRYEIRLVLRTAERSDAASTTTFEVVESR